MAVIHCKNCGGSIELSADKTFGTCEFCGSTMTFPKVDDDQRAAAFNRGNHFRRIGEFDKALAVYERIVAEDHTDAEAHWCCALCRFGIEYVEDPATLEWMPTCHRASFDSFLEDVDYKAALQYSDGVTRRQYQKEANKIAEVQRGILAEVQNAEPYDVFICYKETDENGDRTRDSLLAQEIYYELLEEGKKVFFARITLESVVGQKYEPVIFAALNSAKVMIVVGTKPEHLNAVWVKNEWSRFLALMKKDRSRLLLPCYRDMDPYDLPEQLSVLQSYDMAKIGFIQDLIHGINKVLSAQRRPAPAKPAPAPVRQEPELTTDNFVERGNLALADGNWRSADRFFEEALNRDHRCAEAYLGKALAAEQAENLDALVDKILASCAYAEPEKKSLTKQSSRIVEAGKKYSILGYLSPSEIVALYYFDLGYQSTVKTRKDQRAAKELFWDDHPQLSRAMEFADGETAEKLKAARQRLAEALDYRVSQAEQDEHADRTALQASYDSHLDLMDQRAQEMYQEAEDKRNALYRSLLSTMDTTDDPAKLREAAGELEMLGNYLDCPQQAEACREKARVEQAKLDRIAAEKKAAADAEAARKREFEARQKAKQEAKARTKRIIATVVTLTAIAAALVIFFVVIPTSRYNEAASLMAAEDYAGAYKIYTDLGDFKDSKDQALLARQLRSQKHIKQAEAYLAQGDDIHAAIEYIHAGDPIRAEAVLDFHNILLAGKNCSVGIGTLGINYYQADGVSTNFYDNKAAVDSMQKIISFDQYDGVLGLNSEGRLVCGEKAVLGVTGDYWDQALSYTNVAQALNSYKQLVLLHEDGNISQISEDDYKIFTTDWKDMAKIGYYSDGVWGLDRSGKLYCAKEADGDVYFNPYGMPALKKVVPFSFYDGNKTRYMLMGITMDNTVYGLVQVNVQIDWEGEVTGVSAPTAPAAEGAYEDYYTTSQILPGLFANVADLEVSGSTLYILRTDGTVSTHCPVPSQTDSGIASQISKNLAQWEDVVSLQKEGTGLYGITYSGKVYYQCLDTDTETRNGTETKVISNRSNIAEKVATWENVIFVTATNWDYSSTQWDHVLALKADGTVTSLNSGKYYTLKTSANDKYYASASYDGTYDQVGVWKLW